MATILKELELRDNQAWRAWLEREHTSSPGVWLVYYKKHTGARTIPYEDSVREALCFGWVDSIIKRLDDARCARKFTPRRPASKWSESNRKRWAELKAAGRLAAAGLAAAPTANKYSPVPEVPELPAYIARALKKNLKVWNFFRQLAPSHRREYVRWIHFAKRPETRERRIAEAVSMLKAKQKLGLR